jgi:DNA repair protein RadC
MTPQNVFVFWEDIISKDPTYEPDKEHLIAILVDVKHKPQGYHVVSVGSLNEALAHPREVFRAAIVGGSYGFILLHNHPSGDPSPSDADRRLTRRIQEGADLLQVKLLDHVICGDAEGGRQPFYSFRQSGLI